MPSTWRLESLIDRKRASQSSEDDDGFARHAQVVNVYDNLTPSGRPHSDYSATQQAAVGAALNALVRDEDTVNGPAALGRDSYSSERSIGFSGCELSRGTTHRKFAAFAAGKPIWDRAHEKLRAAGSLARSKSATNAPVALRAALTRRARSSRAAVGGVRARIQSSLGAGPAAHLRRLSRDNQRAIHAELAGHYEYAGTVQPDGSRMKIKLHGHHLLEWGADGTVVVTNVTGFCLPGASGGASESTDDGEPAASAPTPAAAAGAAHSHSESMRVRLFTDKHRRIYGVSR